MADLFSSLPYVLPKNNKDVVQRLAIILSIDPKRIPSHDQKIIEILSGIILYRHLERLQKIQVMTQVRSLEPRLQSILVTKITDVIVQPKWGLWSLTNEELLDKKEFHEGIATIANALGIAASVSGLNDIMKMVAEGLTKRQSLKTMAKRALPYFIIWGAVQVNANELARMQREIDARTPAMLTSPLH